MLSEFYIRQAKLPRTVPFTFKDDGFYITLKKEVREVLKTLPKRPANRSKYLTDLLFLSYISLACSAIYIQSYMVGALAGVLLSLTTIAAHNFFHQKDNFRMYYFDFSLMPSK